MQKMTEEESQLVHDYIFGEWARKVLERDLKKISVFKYPDIYQSLLEKALHRLSLDMRDIKKEMFDRNINVYELDIKYIQTGKTFRYQIKCRGFIVEWNFMDNMLRYHTKKRLEKYMGLRD